MVDLSVVIPALNEARNLAHLLPRLREVLSSLGISYETLVITRQPDQETRDATSASGAVLVEQSAPGYGGALRSGFAKASGAYLVTMDADLSHRPNFILDLWRHRE